MLNRLLPEPILVLNAGTAEMLLQTVEVTFFNNLSAVEQVQAKHSWCFGVPQRSPLNSGIVVSMAL